MADSGRGGFGRGGGRGGGRGDRGRGGRGGRGGRHHHRKLLDGNVYSTYETDLPWANIPHSAPVGFKPLVLAADNTAQFDDAPAPGLTNKQHSASTPMFAGIMGTILMLFCAVNATLAFFAKRWSLKKQART